MVVIHDLNDWLRELRESSVSPTVIIVEGINKLFESNSGQAGSHLAHHSSNEQQ